ncbi:MAG: hypothetical protein EZS28_006560 [Streblomastix strix]|uniref:Uncharacterized protein n=1 Tax=Streblomastix strix TaxID=222440 RepID=A0A5J4WTM5_9EUKA|nr:MAG: hypothetical protein EZS28_006560 [Streblomastix strix]
MVLSEEPLPKQTPFGWKAKTSTADPCPTNIRSGRRIFIFHNLTTPSIHPLANKLLFGENITDKIGSSHPQQITMHFFVHVEYNLIYPSIPLVIMNSESRENDPLNTHPMLCP